VSFARWFSDLIVVRPEEVVVSSGGRAMKVLDVSGGERLTESGVQHLTVLARICLLQF
jgi:hypothetical protein